MFCEKCGKQIADDAKFCPECGIPLDNNKVASQAAKSVPQLGTVEGKKGNGCLGAFLIALAVIVLLSIIVLFSIIGSCTKHNEYQQASQNIEEIDPQVIQNNSKQLYEWMKNQHKMTELARDEGFNELKGKTVCFRGKVREVGKTILDNTPYVSLQIDSEYVIIPGDSEHIGVRGINIQFNFDKSLISVIKDWHTGEMHDLQGTISSIGIDKDGVVCTGGKIIK